MSTKAFHRAVSLVVFVGMVAACADVTASTSSTDDSVITTGTSVTVSATETTTTTTVVPPTTTTTEPSTTSRVTTATALGPSAADTLDDFFVAVLAADDGIAAAAQVYNAGFDEVEGTLTAEAKEVVMGLEIGNLGWLIPAGLSIDLETAVLTVYSDLVSRAAGLLGGAAYLQPEPDPNEEFNRQNLEYAMVCLGHGHDANARFDADLAEAVRLAQSEIPPPPLAPESKEAGVLAVRVAYIDGANGGDNCGGFIYTEALPVDWENRAVDAETRVGFDAEFVDDHWQIRLHAG